MRTLSNISPTFSRGDEFSMIDPLGFSRAGDVTLKPHD